ncbi:MAG: M3 family metallopeptidase [Rhizomicrobium sp.]
MPDNPFSEIWQTPFEAPPFDQIRPEHFRPAFETALREHNAEIDAIASNPSPPDFSNTIEALERSGHSLRRIEHVFYNLASSHTNSELQAIELEMAPVLSRHSTAIYLNSALFARIDQIWREARNHLRDDEHRRVLDRYRLDFIRAGAQLDKEQKERFAQISERLAVLGTEFAQAVLADEQQSIMPLSAEDAEGLPEFARIAAAELAREHGLDSPYAVNASRSSVEAVLTFAHSRPVREKVLDAWASRGQRGNAHDNRARMGEILKLRLELARLLGYTSFADFRLADTMAKTPVAARALLDKVWTPALQRAKKERDELQALITEEGGNFALTASDWRYYAERLRKVRYDIDDNEIMPYLPLEAMIAAAFDAASRLFDLSFHERHDVPVYHPDVRVFEVRRHNEPIGLFYGDYFARSSKRGGAWMSSFRDQQNLDGKVLPLIINNCNFSKPAEGSPALLNLDEARTLFHEFGHALHGLLSNVRFPRLSGTNVAQDFVELPSQIFEHWFEVQLENFARHVITGEPMPKTLRDKLIAARHFNQGFSTVEFLGSAFVDMDFHTVTDVKDIDPQRIAHQSAARLGIPPEIPLRHAPAHFLHIFGGDGYAAGYYAYMWAEVLDADGFAAFTEAGNPFDPDTARRLYEDVYSVGGTRDYEATYRHFRGRDPRIDALLAGRGLV